MSAQIYVGGDPNKLDATGYTKGDIIAADASGDLQPVTVGPDGDVLTADSVAAEGVDWQPGGGGGGGTPSNTVVTETSFGQGASAGVAIPYSRGDHTHGTPAAPSVPSASGTVVTETTFGQGSTAGAAATFSRGDHTHGTPAAPSVPSASGTVTTETSFGQASNAGAAATYSKGDHTHGTPAAPTAASVAAPQLYTFSKSGTLTTQVGTARLYNDTGRTLTISTVRASVGTAPTGQSIIVDININGTTIFGTQANRPTIAAAGNTSGSDTGFSVSSITNGQFFTIDIDQVGSGTAGSDLTVQILVTG